jgi:hypothetical protein
MFLYGKGMEMKKAMQITVLVLLAAAVAVGAEAKSATILLQEGIYAEETEGNLDKAIGIYQEASKSAQVTEKAAAEAVFRTGMCYLKKGDKAAAAAQFGVVISKYSSQKAIVEQANKQLSSLGMGGQEPELPEDVKSYIVAQQLKHCVEADKLGIAANGQVYGVDADLNCYRGGMNVFKNTTGKTLGSETGLGGTSYGNIQGVDGEKLRTVRSNSTSGPQYQLYWTPNPPVGPNDVRIIGWRIPGSTKLIVTNGKGTLAMQNYYGPEVVESFYLLVAKGSSIDSKGVEPTAKGSFSNYDVYEWTKRVPKNTNHTVSVLVTPGNPEAAKPMEIGAVPWTDGEICKMSLKTKAGMNIGGLYYSPRLIQKPGGTDVWQLDSYQLVTVNDSRQFTRVEADAATFAPTAGRTINDMGDFVAAYEHDKVTLSTTINGKTTTKNMPVTGQVYDNEEALMLIRRLPLAEGYGTTFQIFTVQGGTTVECQIAVEGKEDVTVPFGTSACWKVKLAVYSGAIKALEHTLWFSADEKKLLMKYDAGTALMELTEVTKVQPQTLYTDKDTRASFVLPAGWIALMEVTKGAYKPYAMITCDGLETWSCMAGTSAANMDVDAAVDGDITTLQGFFKDYTPREGSRATVKVDGVPAVRYVADYVDDDKAMVEYRTYLVKNGTIFWFVFRTDKDKFEGNKATYDGIVGSFVVAGK